MKLNIRLIFKIIFSLVFILALVGCAESNKYNQKKKEGYTITVRYEANGGTYLDREGITLIDMFNPNDYSKDSNGTTHIKLVEPTDSSRPSGGSEGIYITRSNYFLVGWYKNREIRVNELNQPVNENGEALELKEDKYYLLSDGETVSEVAYDYSGYWDFKNDTIDYTRDMTEYDLTLYAVWSEYFEFDYYYLKNNQWTYLDKTTFDYKTTNQEGSKTADKDTIWLPSYEDGAMNYTHKYMNNSTYTFPKVSGYTFDSAYLDEELTNQIEDSYEHTGYINYETGKAVNAKNNVYITLIEGEYYYISSPSQLSQNANLNGIYVIENDLDFTDVEWPSIFSLGTFTGKIYSREGGNYSLKNISIYHSNDTAKFGGIFGSIAGNSEIHDVNFENITLDLAYVGRRNRDTNFGLFSGLIEAEASISNVSISGTIRIGAITPGDNYSINLVANGNNLAITTLDTIHVVIYGTEQGEVYNYTVDPDNTTIDESGYITLASVTALKKTNDSYSIQ